MGRIDGTAVKLRDLRRLLDRRWVTDECINFAMRLLLKEAKGGSRLTRAVRLGFGRATAVYERGKALREAAAAAAAGAAGAASALSSARDGGDGGAAPAPRPPRADGYRDLPERVEAEECPPVRVTGPFGTGGRLAHAMTSFLAERMVTTGAEPDKDFTREALDLLPSCSRRTRTRLLKEGLPYEYDNVKRWLYRRNCAELAHLDVVLIPVHVAKSHWVFVGVHVRDKRLIYYDSLSSKSKRGVLAPGTNAFHLTAVVRRWVRDEGQSAIERGACKCMPGEDPAGGGGEDDTATATTAAESQAKEEDATAAGSGPTTGTAGEEARPAPGSEASDRGQARPAGMFDLRVAKNSEQQDNGNDCGLFAAENARNFLR